jgi:hypothetical protein
MTIRLPITIPAAMIMMAQVVKRGDPPEIVVSGITLE